MDIEPVPPLSAAAEIAILRIAGEALANVSRHARARHCRITLGTAGELVELTIGDDGIGPPSAGAPGRGVGLDSMRQRATVSTSENCSGRVPTLAQGDGGEQRGGCEQRGRQIQRVVQRAGEGRVACLDNLVERTASPG